jgi:hypothetical protein
MYAKNEFLTKAWLQIQIIFQILNLNSYTRLKSKTYIKQFPKITSTLPEVLLIKAKP